MTGMANAEEREAAEERDAAKEREAAEYKEATEEIEAAEEMEAQRGQERGRADVQQGRQASVGVHADWPRSVGDWAMGAWLIWFGFGLWNWLDHTWWNILLLCVIWISVYAAWLASEGVMVKEAESDHSNGDSILV